MLAACGHRCCRSGHGDGDASANPSMALLQLLCNVATKDGRACYQWQAPAYSAATHGACPAPPSTAGQAQGPHLLVLRRPPKLGRRSCNHGVVEHCEGWQGRRCYLWLSTSLHAVGVRATLWRWRLLRRAAAATTKGGGATTYATIGVGVLYRGRRSLLQKAAATATKGDGATAAATIGVGLCYEGRKCLLQ
jgi:hypothetical protein